MSLLKMRCHSMGISFSFDAEDVTHTPTAEFTCPGFTQSQTNKDITRLAHCIILILQAVADDYQWISLFYHRLIFGIRKIIHFK